MMPAATVARTRRKIRRTASGVPLPRSDGRTTASRRFKALVETYAAELGGPLGEAEQALISMATALTMAGEALAADIASGKQVDPDSMVRINSEARRVLASLRERAAKSKPPRPTSLAEILEREENRA
jgi:hypothetical protein